MSSRLLEIVAGVERLKVVENTVEGDVGNLEVCITEVATLCKQLFHPMGKDLEQEPLRFMSMLSASGRGGGAGNSHGRYVKSIMEHKVIQNLTIMSGDKSLFRQWHQKFTTGLGRANATHEEIVHRMV